LLDRDHSTPRHRGLNRVGCHDDIFQRGLVTVAVEGLDGAAFSEGALGDWLAMFAGADD
jgi:hypothetical protein